MYLQHRSDRYAIITHPVTGERIHIHSDHNKI